MTGERWQEVKQVLDQLEDCPPEDRERSLAAACNGDPDLRREVESLLSFETRADLLERSANRNARAAWDRIGPYRVERLLGSGGMGSVFLAARDDDQYHKKVAIKVIQWAGDPETTSRFRTERQVLANLDHPNIARLLDGGTLPDGLPYLVMDYIDGCPIDVFVREHGLESEPTLRLFLKVCSAVQFAHQNLIVHRDLKAGNFLVGADGEPHLLDFGIAKLLNPLGPELDRTQPWQRILTPASASPEQAAGGPVTTASDVYSLGILLYTLLTGVPFYGGSKNFATDPGRVILEYDPPPPSQAPGLSPRVSRLLAGDLDNIVRKAAAKDPSLRYPTVEEFAADIRRHLDGHPVAARPASLFYRAEKFALRNRLFVSAAALLLFAIGAGVAGTGWYAYRAHLAESKAERRFEALHGITNSMLFEVDDAIANLQGATAARAAIVRRALQYLDQLSADSGENSAVLQDLAAAYTRIGVIQGTVESAHLGGPGSLDNARDSYLKASAIVERLIAAEPNNLDFQIAIYEPLGELAELYRTQGDLDRSLATTRDLESRMRAVAARAPAHSSQYTESQYSLGTALTILGANSMLRGDSTRALDYLHEALAVRSALARDHPGDKRALRVLGISHIYLCFALETANRWADAAAEARLSLDTREPLSAADPRNNELHDFVADSDRHLCLDLAHTGNYAEALLRCNVSVDLDRQAVALDPNNSQALENLALVYSAMSELKDSMGRPRDALDWEVKARHQFVALRSVDPDSFETATFDASSLLHTGTLEVRLGMRPEALRDLRQATDMLRLQTKQSPKNQVIADLYLRAATALQQYR